MKNFGITVLAIIILQTGSSQTISLNIKAFLEGPFFGNEMKTDLNSGGYLPLNQPYNVSPWNYPGAESMSVTPANVVDWVLVEALKNSIDTTNQPSQVIGRQAALIKNTGEIIDIDGYSPLTIPSVSDSLFFVRVTHRNHLSVTSSIVVPIISGTYTYDFTTGPEKSYKGIASLKQLTFGKLGMYAADGDANGQIDNRDKNNLWLSQLNSFGYMAGDFNLDGEAAINDLNGKWAINAGQGSRKGPGILSVCVSNPRYF